MDGNTVYITAYINFTRDANVTDEVSITDIMRSCWGKVSANDVEMI